MEKPIIEIRNLGKRYSITHMKGGYVSLRDVIMGVLKSPFSFVKSKAKQVVGLEKKEEFWALKNIDMTIRKGEIVGVIGSNGAGKSTLLKILTGITPPTEGEAIIRGRVGSLLEVGTGFHPELTGRDNIFLNGALLGMKKKEIEKKFDEIVAFAGIEKFLDTVVKHYSSGMYVRLAFSVAAHMDTEILLIDEVLAVGDAEFQKKCLGKMNEITKTQGRTIIFVSHNMEAIKKLCTHCILLDKGEKIFEGSTEETLSVYSNRHTGGEITINKGEYTNTRRGSGTLSFTNIAIEDTDNSEKNTFYVGETVRFKLSYAVYEAMEGLHTSVAFLDSGTGVFLTDVWYEIEKGPIEKDAHGTVAIDVDLTSMRPGIYSLYFWLGDSLAIRQGTPTNYDTVDGVTKPLIVRGKEKVDSKYTGSFSLPSRMVSV